MYSSEVYYKPTFDNIPGEKRKKILDVAINDFANRGFENANINTIAKKAEVSVGSLYKYFDTKTDLFMTCISYGIGYIESILKSVTSSDEDVMIKLEKLVRITIEYSRKYGVLVKLYNQFTSESDPERAIKLARKMESITASCYKKDIEEGQLSGEIRQDIDCGMAAFMVDNILMNLQFSYACDYYRERYRIFVGEDVFGKDDMIVDNILRFVKASLK